MIEFQRGDMKPEDCNTKGCVFCSTTDPNLHVSFCNMCKKCLCDICRKKYPLRAAAAATEKFTAVTLSAEALKERMKKWSGRS